MVVGYFPIRMHLTTRCRTDNSPSSGDCQPGIDRRIDHFIILTKPAPFYRYFIPGWNTWRIFFRPPTSRPPLHFGKFIYVKCNHISPTKFPENVRECLEESPLQTTLWGTICWIHPWDYQKNSWEYDHSFSIHLSTSTLAFLEAFRLFFRSSIVASRSTRSTWKFISTGS